MIWFISSFCQKFLRRTFKNPMKVSLKIRGMIKYEISSIFEFLMKSHDQSFILESIIFKTGNVKTNLKGFRLTDDFAGSDLAVQTEILSGISFKL